MIGTLALLLALLTTLMAAALCLRDASQAKKAAQATSAGSTARATSATVTARTTPAGSTARLLTFIATVCVVVAALALWYALLQGDYRLRYVYAFSQAELPFFYKIAAFWAGQEGSFLLWVLLSALLALPLVKRLPAAALPAYLVIQASLIIMTIIKNPFLMMEGIPATGAGLNPLLQNPWMVIHPPLLFLGYTGLAVPWSLALGALYTADSKSWVKQALPWTLLGWTALGLGMATGGFWAYEVLGWGGYWAWDPVENSSLIPWLLAGALFHFLLVARRQEQIIKPAFCAAVFTYLTTLYGTFLTRSGALSDFSTHSFADEGIGTALALLVLGTALASLLPLILKWQELPGATSPLRSRPFLVQAGGVLLSALAGVVLLGTSVPLITALFGKPQSLRAGFYNLVSLPLVCGLLAVLVAAYYYGWSEHAKRPRQRTPSLRLNHPATLGHLGFAVLLAGVLISGLGGSTATLSLTPGEVSAALGTELVYLEERALADGYEQVFSLGGREVSAVTKLSPQGYSVHEPAVRRGLTADYYLVPSFLQDYEEISLTEGVPAVLATDLQVTLTAFGMNSDNSGVYADLDITRAEEITSIRTEMRLGADGAESVPVLALERYELNLAALSVGERSILLRVSDSESAAGTLAVELSRKPFINFVWAGMILITLGGCAAIIRRVNHPVATPPKEGNRPL
jgi:cytochrome c-type biogenesis protein CcmF